MVVVIPDFLGEDDDNGKDFEDMHGPKEKGLLPEQQKMQSRAVEECVKMTQRERIAIAKRLIEGAGTKRAPHGCSDRRSVVRSIKRA